MKHVYTLLLSFLFALSVTACGEQADVANSVAQGTDNGMQSTDSSAQAVKPVDVDVNQAREALAEVVVLDVRSPGEFANGHIEGAINIHINGPDFSTAIAQLDREQTYLVHCAVNPKNGRAEKALDAMSDMGFNNLQNLVGGYSAWQGTM